MPFASALSEHPLTAQAVGEVAGRVLETLGRRPDLAMIFLTPPHGGALEDAAAAVRSILEPRTLLGCAAVAVAGSGREVEFEPGVSLWAGKFGEHGDQVVPVRLTEEMGAFGPEITGWPDDLPFDPSALLLIADPFSFRAEDLFELVDQRHRGLPVIGGMASAARGPGGNRIALDETVVTAGAVGAILGPDIPLRTVVSQGCRPIGMPLVVTRSEGQFVHELAGEPPLQRRLEQAKQLPEGDIALINRGLHLGLVIDEHKVEFERGDFLIRNVFGADRETGTMQVGDDVEIGTTVQFQVRDAQSADEDLKEMLAGTNADGVLLFTCNGRGTNLFAVGDHDATVIADMLGPVPMAGFFAAGELGPDGGRNFLHGFTASMALFTD
jgi:small ligand-binding sensory domain FIST